MRSRGRITTQFPWMPDTLGVSVRRSPPRTTAGSCDSRSRRTPGRASWSKQLAMSRDLSALIRRRAKSSAITPTAWTPTSPTYGCRISRDISWSGSTGGWWHTACTRARRCARERPRLRAQCRRLRQLRRFRRGGGSGGRHFIHQHRASARQSARRDSVVEFQRRPSAAAGPLAAETRSRVDRGRIRGERRIFYTGLYHALLYPKLFSEHGRYYSAFDDKVHEGVSYTAYSLWDTFRAENSLLTLLVPERIDDMVRALLQDYREGGWMPKWPNPSYTNIMIATHADAVVAEAINKGFHGFDYRLAYEAVYKDAMTPPEGDTTRDWHDREEGVPYEARAGLTYYKLLGYVPADKDRGVGLGDAGGCLRRLCGGAGRESARAGVQISAFSSIAPTTTAISSTRRADSCREKTPTAPGRARRTAGPKAISGSIPIRRAPRCPRRGRAHGRARAGSRTTG